MSLLCMHSHKQTNTHKYTHYVAYKRGEREREMEGGVRQDRWGNEVKSSSDACITAINSYYLQFLSYGRERRVILEATLHDKNCVLANVLAAYSVSSCNPSRVALYLQSARSRLEEATSYEKAVFDAVTSLLCENRDDDVAFEFHSKVSKFF
uniref:Integral membrane protein n=1 Tax=Rhizophora mucronata TaxID=61149 RepID=A0A2P2MLB7_RHIMU